jgi:AraC-like DNA-binding protein
MTFIEDRLGGTGTERARVRTIDFDEDARGRPTGLPAGLALSLLTATWPPDQVRCLCTDRARPRPRQGGLAPWQEKRSKTMLAGDLSGATPLVDIAKACGLSVSHFSRSFRRSAGLAPHAWLLRVRVEAAKAMLRQSEASLCLIAVACGFADQTHFTRVFARRTGLSPGAWRKYLAEGTGHAWPVSTALLAEPNLGGGRPGRRL